ncbi:DUF3078 domain-containing protein [Flavobacterium sp.]|uniref:DUF3078 domain-containing protein n=1 Tax=Flavobacterium sp. TaxID=239 RepID=UPI003BC5D493
MMKVIFAFALMLNFSFLFAQTAEKENINQNELAAARKTDTLSDVWKKNGKIMVLFNQSAFNNAWMAGGTSSMAGNFVLNYDFNYKKGINVWDNKFIAAYGLTKLKGALRNTKTDDRLEWNSLYGKKAIGNWYYSAFLNIKSQMDSGFDSTGSIRISHFFSPAYLQAGPGILWKKSDNLKFNFAPATSRLIIVDGKFTKLTSSFGVDQVKTTRYEFGASVLAYYKLKIMENVSVENILNLYSNYLDKPKNVDVDYQMNLVMKVNKYMSANVSFQAIYDDNANPIKSEVQIREVFGLGINYGF